MAGLSTYLKKHPWVMWGLALFVVPAIIVGLTTTSRIQGSPKMVSYGNRRDELKVKAERLGLIVDPAKYVPPTGTGPDGSIILRKAEAAWVGSKQTKLDREQLLQAIRAFDETTWLDPGSFGNPYASPSSHMAVAGRIEPILEELIIDKEFEQALSWVQALLLVAKPRQAGSFGQWLGSRCSAEDRALKSVLDLAVLAQGDAKRLAQIDDLLKRHPFQVDFRKEAAAAPAHYLAVLDHGDYRGNTMFFRPCVDVLKTPDQCVMARTDWPVFRRAVEGLAYENWAMQMKNMDDPWKLAADCDEIQASFFNASNGSSFGVAARIALAPLSDLSRWVTDLLVRESIALYVLEALQYEAAHGTWPTDQQLSLPRDPWSDQPIQVRKDDVGRALWSVGVDRVNNFGADHVYDDGGDSRQRDIRIDFPPREGFVAHDMTTGGRRAGGQQFDRVFRGAKGEPSERTTP